MASGQRKTALNIVMGAMTFGEEGKNGVRVGDLKDVNTILDVFQKHGHSEVDTAIVYVYGTSEQYLGKLGWQKRGLIVDTKLYPYAGMISHSPEDIRKFMEISLKSLQTDSVHMWYLHGPDRKTPYEDTLRAVNELYEEGKFEKFGISNYMAWEVAEIVSICKRNGWVQPMAYQGLYNAVHRTVEPELFPCLRKYGMVFYEFNPHTAKYDAVGGGFFMGWYRSLEDKGEAGSRFDAGTMQGTMYCKRSWNKAYFRALAKIEAVAQKHDLTLAEIALRWVSPHSMLKCEHGDAVLIGTSSVAHIEQNLVNLEKGPLPEEVVKVLDEAWFEVFPYASVYFH